MRWLASVSRQTAAVQQEAAGLLEWVCRWHERWQLRWMTYRMRRCGAVERREDPMDPAWVRFVAAEYDIDNVGAAQAATADVQAMKRCMRSARAYTARCNVNGEPGIQQGVRVPRPISILRHLQQYCTWVIILLLLFAVLVLQLQVVALHTRDTLDPSVGSPWQTWRKYARPFLPAVLQYSPASPDGSWETPPNAPAL